MLIDRLISTTWIFLALICRKELHKQINKSYPPIAVETKAGTLLLLNHYKTMQDIWGRHLRDKTREGLFCLQVIRLFPERLCHLFNKFFTLILHWKLGQNRHNSIAWSSILKHTQANMLRKQQWITTNSFCTGFLVSGCLSNVSSHIQLLNAVDAVSHRHPSSAIRRNQGHESDMQKL